MVGAEGVNGVFLEREGTKKSGFTWYQKTQWLNPEQAGWLAYLATLQMQALWTCHGGTTRGATGQGSAGHQRRHRRRPGSVSARRERAVVEDIRRP
jgi:hypothetical protein